MAAGLVNKVLNYFFSYLKCTNPYQTTAMVVWVRIPIVELSTFFGSFRKLGLGFNAGLLLQDDRNPAADNFFYSGTFDGDVQMRVGQKPGQE